MPPVRHMIPIVELQDIVWAITTAALLTATILQLLPLDIKPWSALLAAIGKAINKEVSDKIDDLEKRIIAFQEKVDEAEEMIEELEKKGGKKKK